MSDDHLFVLLHGFWGNPSHLQRAKEILLAEHPDVQVLVPASYSGNLTYDGVQICGTRVIDEIKDFVESLRTSDNITIKKFSIVGYSLGGLIARYVVGELYNSGFFRTVVPMNFTTFATPHLGVCSEKDGKKRTIFNFYGRRWLSQSGRDMFLGPGGIVPQMADPQGYYYIALARFERLSLYSNICYDRSVPFFTAFITDRDPFTDLAICKPRYVEKYSPTIVDLSKPMNILEKPVKRRWSRRDYVLLTTLVTVGPILILGALATITVSAQLSELRLYELVNGKTQSKPKKMLLSYIASPSGKGEHHDTEASIVQTAVEDMMDTSEMSDSVQSGPEETEATSSGTSISSRAAGNTSDGNTSNLDVICNAIVAHKESNPEFGVTVDSALDIEDIQKRMVEDMNKLPWNKYAVHIHGTTHSHAAIVNRSKKSPEGDVVLGHWAERVVI